MRRARNGSAKRRRRRSGKRGWKGRDRGRNERGGDARIFPGGGGGRDLILQYDTKILRDTTIHALPPSSPLDISINFNAEFSTRFQQRFIRGRPLRRDRKERNDFNNRSTDFDSISSEKKKPWRNLSRTRLVPSKTGILRINGRVFKGGRITRSGKWEGIEGRNFLDNSFPILASI